MLRTGRDPNTKLEGVGTITVYSTTSSMRRSMIKLRVKHWLFNYNYLELMISNAQELGVLGITYPYTTTVGPQHERENTLSCICGSNSGSTLYVLCSPQHLPHGAAKIKAMRVKFINE